MNEIGRRITQKLIELHGSSDFIIGFLPYKRSMWDCMESVYEECRAAGAVAYILPLPYYRMRGRKVVDKIDSDADLFPDALDISMLEKISFDFLVIHYPYDDRNIVTSMLPPYHTAELRKYGKVVFIPYSCSPGLFTRVHAGLANVDYAFLCSDAECEAFIEAWLYHEIDFSGRVFGYGSPKMDAMQKCGSGSATLLINSLAPFLAEPFIRLSKYKDAIQRELDRGREVIFRPHPLLRQTLISMRPDALPEYDDLLLWIHGTDHAEVDESEDLEAALSRADFMIADQSSVLEMWQSAGRECVLL